MMTTPTPQFDTMETLIANERPRLLHFCTYLTGSAHAAEDLAQETLLTAWRRRDTITDPAGLSHWLKAIARNLCRNWQRSQTRQRQHRLPTDPHDNKETDAAFDVADSFDLELELERSELITLLDQALGLLPAETRGLLIQHYIEELPQAELAAQVGLSTGAVGVRLHRGKLALQRVLTTDFRDAAVAFGLVSANETAWVETRIWCFQCGNHPLQARFNPEQDHLCLRCPRCCNLADEEDALTDSCIQGLGTYKAFRPAFTHVQKSVHDIYFGQKQVGLATCRQCGASIPIRHGVPLGWQLPRAVDSIYAVCDHCQEGSLDSWLSVALCLPQVRQFWRDHPRMRSVPTDHAEVAGTPAVLVGFESVTGSAKIEVAFTWDTFQVLYVDGQTA